MNTITHPGAEDLIAYLEAPQAEVFTNICLHLAHCRECRNQAERLSNLEKIIKRDGAELSGYSGEKTQELKQAEEETHIGLYVDGMAQGEDKMGISDMIDCDPRALKAALHYACHSSAMKRELEVEHNVAPSPVEKSSRQNIQPGAAPTWGEKIQKWFNLSVWIAIPATAAATALLVTNLAPVFMMSDNVTVASYQDNPIVQFQNKDQLPGMGFFSKSVNIIKPFNSMAVTIPVANSITLDWPKIDGAISYTLRLQMIDNGQKIILAEKSTPDTWLTMSGINTRMNHRYEWILSGKTKDEQTFYSTGGFVIHHTGR